MKGKQFTIKQSIVEQIIKEEVFKIKKIKLLKEEESNIIKQLNELYEEEGEIDEGLGKLLFGTLSYEETLQKIMSHPVFSRVYNQIPSEEQKRAYVDFAMKNFDYLGKGVTYIPEKGKYQMGKSGQPSWGFSR